ncbi:MAG TPA: low molecular weight phosphatase family protein [Enteractinococcus sp.]
MTIRILTVCTGNICRSPLAAELLASRLDPQNFIVESAGTSALVGEQMPDPAIEIATRLGARAPEHHRAVVLTSETVVAADLILGMELDHRRRAAQLHPTAVRRSFTLLEFAHIAAQITDAQLISVARHWEDPYAAALDTVMRMRGVVSRLPTERDYDVEDPFGRLKQVYERSARQVDRAVNQIVTFFAHASVITVNSVQH